MQMMSHEQEEEYKKDLNEMVEAYRTFRHLGRWAVWGFGILLTIASFFLALKELFKK